MKSLTSPLQTSGPNGNRFFGPTVTESRRYPLEFMNRLAREYGDVCAFRVGFERIFFVNHPDYVREILVNHYGNFIKGGRKKKSKRFLGEGLLLSEGDVHRQRRRIDQQAFHRQRIAAYGAEMVASAERCSSRWQDGQVLDVWPEMLRTALSIVGKTLFSADVESKDDEVGRAMNHALIRYQTFRLPFASLLDRLPLLAMRLAARGTNRLRKVVMQIIEERRRTGHDHGDLLSMLLIAENDNNGDNLSAEQVWDEALTLFIAGYDTIATALMWTWYLLSEYPEIEAKLHAELDDVLAGGRAPRFDDLKRLPYTERVLAEAMRIYPPVWRVVRRAVKDFKIGEHVIPSRALVVVCQYTMHRDPRYFPEPERFDPERFAPEAKAARPQFSYFPFGGGPRRCLGEGFALTEGVLVIATLARRWRLRLVPGHPVEVLPQHLLRAKHGMVMSLEKR